MSKIVVIKGSARKGGNSNSMADAFIEAAKGLGHEIVECNATKMNLNGCHGCMTCFKTGKACTHDDDFNTIADDLLEADGWGDSNEDGVLDRLNDEGKLVSLNMNLYVYEEPEDNVRIETANFIKEELAVVGINVSITTMTFTGIQE